jgi:hypothetical protein
LEGILIEVSVESLKGESLKVEDVEGWQRR